MYALWFDAVRRWDFGGSSRLSYNINIQTAQLKLAMESGREGSLVARKLGRPDWTAAVINSRIATRMKGLVRAATGCRGRRNPARVGHEMLEVSHQMNGFPPVTAMVVPEV